MEFRHGPKSMVTAQTLVVGLVSESKREYELQVMDDLRAMGAQSFTLGEADGDLPFHSRLPELLRGPLYLPPLQLLAYERSLAKGLNPDRPHNLDAVVTLTQA
jgi:glucosamine--fructose-6-phosphate aminotransferase (isomerizing)